MNTKRLAQLAGIHSSLTENAAVDDVAVDEQPKPVEIPSEVLTELKKAIQSQLDAGNSMKAAGREQEMKFHFTAAEFLSELENTLGERTPADIKRASVKVHSARDSIMRTIPKTVYNFLIPSTFNIDNKKSLKERFDEVNSTQ